MAAIPCAGDDRWIVQSQWLGDSRNGWRLCERAGSRRLGGRLAVFPCSLGRLQQKEELDRVCRQSQRFHVGRSPNWRKRYRLRAFRRAPCWTARDCLFNDPHLRDRRFYEVVRHHPRTGMPPLPYASRPWKLSETPSVPPKPAPLMGEHNEFVLRGVAGADRTRHSPSGRGRRHWILTRRPAPRCSAPHWTNRCGRAGCCATRPIFSGKYLKPTLRRKVRA